MLQIAAYTLVKILISQIDVYVNVVMKTTYQGPNMWYSKIQNMT